MGVCINFYKDFENVTEEGMAISAAPDYNPDYIYDYIYDAGIEEIYTLFPHSLRGMDDVGFVRLGEEFPQEVMMSYGGYNRFREDLCIKAYGVTTHDVWNDLDKYRGREFFDIINFADNEGVLGSVAVSCLAHDFSHYDFDWGIQYGYNSHQKIYNKFRDGFNFASHGGLAIFR